MTLNIQADLGDVALQLEVRAHYIPKCSELSYSTPSKC
jgi:hypothetical protein